MKKNLIFILFFLVLTFVSAEDIIVWQGQYYTGTTFHQGTYEFNFSVYDYKINGNICFSNTTTLTTGNFGKWKTEQYGVGSACNDDSKDYYLEIKINNEIQDGRRLLKSFSYLRQDTPVLSNQYNYSGTARWQIKNVNSGNTSNTLFSVTNDLGYLLSFGITSSDYFSIPNNRYFANQPSIGQSSFNDLYFVNGRQTGFSWFNNPFNDTSNRIQKIMTLDSNGNLNATGNITTTQTGFFSFLGNTLNRINKLFVKDIDASGSINVTENITLGGQILTDKGCLIPHANFWAERAGSITAGGAPAGLQYSFGDGNTDGGPAQPCFGKVVYLTVHAQTANNGNGKIDLVINNGANSSCNIATPLISGGSKMANCSLSFNAGDSLTPRTTITPSGTNNGYVVSWWVVYD